jgi:hypothetical protein
MFASLSSWILVHECIISVSMSPPYGFCVSGFMVSLTFVITLPCLSHGLSLCPMLLSHLIVPLRLMVSVLPHLVFFSHDFFVSSFGIFLLLFLCLCLSILGFSLMISVFLSHGSVPLSREIYVPKFVCHSSWIWCVSHGFCGMFSISYLLRTLCETCA